MLAASRTLRRPIQDGLFGYDRPMGVATYKTSADMDERLKKLLPPVEELEKLL